MIEGFVLNPNALKLSLTARNVATRTGAVLDKHYHGHVWRIEVDPEGGIIKISPRDLPGRWGFVDKLALWSEPRMVRMAGELLERYRIRRGRADPDQMTQMRRQLFYKPDLG